MSGVMKQISSSRSFNGFQKVFEHESDKLQCAMKFGIYLPDQVGANKFPVLFWLSGITCTEENFILKSGMQRFASAHQIVVVNPDTSPRGAAVPIGFGDDPEFGRSAGFYLNAIEPKFAPNYQMYSYIVDEFVPFIFSQFPVDQSQCGIFGHSMGGLGALQIGLKNPHLFKSISAFAPIANPTNSPNFGQKYFTGFLGAHDGPNRERWAQYDPTEVAKKYTGPKREILIDQGAADPYMAADLLPDNLVAVSNPNIGWNYRLQDGYDHGYYFVHTFIHDHFAFHKECWTGANAGNALN